MPYSLFKFIIPKNEEICKFCNNRLPSTALTHSNFTSTVLSAVLSNKDQLTIIFERILDSGYFASTSTKEDSGLKHFFLDAKFLFLLETFHLPAYKCQHFVLQDEFIDMVYSNSRLKKFSEIRKNALTYFFLMSYPSYLHEWKSKVVQLSNINHPRYQFRHFFLNIGYSN